MLHDNGYPISGIRPYKDGVGNYVDEKWYVVYISFNKALDTFIHRYLHKDGTWQNSTWNTKTLEYSGYFNTYQEAADTLERIGCFPDDKV